MTFDIFDIPCAIAVVCVEEEKKIGLNSVHITLHTDLSNALRH